MQKSSRSVKRVLSWLLVMSLMLSMSFTTYAAKTAEDETAPEGRTLQVLAEETYEITPEERIDVDDIITDMSDKAFPDLEDMPGYFDDMTVPFTGPRAAALSFYATEDTIDIASVEVVNGGEIQAQYRDEVYEGEDGKYYTTLRSASLTDSRRFNFEVIIPAAKVDTTQEGWAQAYINGVEWTYGGIALSDWLGGTAFNTASNHFIQLGAQSISLIESGDNAGDYLLKAAIVFQSPYATASAANPATNIPYAGYSSINQTGFGRMNVTNGAASGPNAGKGIGTYELKAVKGADTLGTRQLRINLYDSFYSWNEIDQYARDLKAVADAGGDKINGRYVKVSSLGQTHSGREIWNVVIARDAQTVEDYLKPGGTKDIMNTNPDALNDQVEAGTLILPFYLNNVHPDEAPGSDTIIQTIDDCIYKDAVTYTTFDDMERNVRPSGGGSSSLSHTGIGTKTDVELEVEDILDNYIVVATITSNPDGKHNLLRTNRYAFDLNRDASFQTQPETIALTRDTTMWDPIAMLEYHGYVTNMLIEPCTLPHDPNYEYDLMHGNMLQLAYDMGKAINANTVLDRFHVPWDHRRDGWDDGGVVYGPMFAMLFGTLGYTIEIPYANEDAVDAATTATNSFLYNSLYGETAAYTDNPGSVAGETPSDPRMRQSMLKNKMEIKRRNIGNIDAKDEVDPYFQESLSTGNRPVGRIRKTDAAGNELSFFPDYVIIPGTPDAQWNVAEAYRTLAVTQRYDTKLDITTEPVTYEGVTYPVGTYVINMKQASRGYINEVMGKGFDASSFASMYAEIVTNYPDTRGFDAVECWAPGLFDGKTSPVTETVEKPASNIVGTPDDYIIFKSNSVDAVRFVNLLLSGRSSGPSYSTPASVWMLSKTVDGLGVMGDYVINASSLAKIDDLVDNVNLGLAGCYLEGKYIHELPAEAKALVDPVIHLTGTRTDSTASSATIGAIYWALDDYLGFRSMKNADESNYNGSGTDPIRPDANVVFLTNSAGSATLAGSVRANKIPVIGVQSSSVNFLTNQLGFTAANNMGISTGSSSGDAIFRVDYNPNSLFSANYKPTNSVYLTGTTYFTVLPENAKELFRTDAINPFIGGFHRNYDTVMPDRVIAFSAFSKEADDQNIPVYMLGHNLFSRPHYHKLYPMLATAIFASAAGILDDQDAPVIDVTEAVSPEAHEINITAVIADTQSGIESIVWEKRNNNTGIYESISSARTGTTETVVDTGLIPYTEYAYRVTVTDYAGNVNVEDIVVTTLVQHATGLKLQGAVTALGVGKTVTITPVFAPLDTTDQSVIWTSSNPSIATVENGVVKALRGGSVTITATAVDGGFSQKTAIRIM